MKLTPRIANNAVADFESAIYPARTYEMNEEQACIAGFTDGLDAVRQAVGKLLRTERCMYPAYSTNYGVELKDKLGMPLNLALPEIKRCVTEALTWDSRIEAVDGFEFEAEGGKVLARFTVHSIYGDFRDETEVGI